MKKILVVLFCLFPTLVFAQSQRNPCYNTDLSNGNQNCVPVGTATPLPVIGSGTQTITGTVAATQSGTWTVNNSGYSFRNITTNTDTVVSASAGVFAGIIINTAGATSSAVVYNDTSCSSTIIGTFNTTVQTSMVINANVSAGICVTTTGGTPADITILYR